MKTRWRRNGSALLALLLTGLMLVTGTAVAMESSAMAADGARMSSTMTHCHHHASTMESMHTDQSTDNHCPDGDACQCVTLCQISAITFTRFAPDAHQPALSYQPDLVIDRSPGIHRLPLRPPSLTV